MICGYTTSWNCTPRVTHYHGGPPGPPGSPGPAGGVSTTGAPVVNLRIPVYDGTTGTFIKDGGVAVADLATVTALGNKVDKVLGKGLSTEDFTSALLLKLNGMALGGYVGTFTDEASLISSQTGPNLGDYAYVVNTLPDPDSEQQLYIWDGVNMVWTPVALGSTPYTGAEIAAVLFATPDVNNLDDTLKAKLENSIDQATFDAAIQTLSGVANPNNNVVPVPGSTRTLSVLDTYKYLRLTGGGACAITLPNDATASWQLTPIICFRVVSVPPTFTLGVGVTLNGAAAIAGLSADSNFCIKKVGVDQWDAVIGGVW